MPFRRPVRVPSQAHPRLFRQFRVGSSVNRALAPNRYTSTSSTFGSDHTLVSTVLTARRALKRMFTDERDSVNGGAYTSVNI